MPSQTPEIDPKQMRAISFVLPEFGKKISHGLPAFHIANRMFAYFRHNNHGDSMTVVCVKTTGREEQEMLIGANPSQYSLAAHMGASGWIAIDLTRADTDRSHIEAKVRARYHLAAPRRRRPQR